MRNLQRGTQIDQNARPLRTHKAQVGPRPALRPPPSLRALHHPLLLPGEGRGERQGRASGEQASGRRFPMSTSETLYQVGLSDLPLLLTARLTKVWTRVQGHPGKKGSRIRTNPARRQCLCCQSYPNSETEAPVIRLFGQTPHIRRRRKRKD